MKIALDAMGGDFGPEVTIAGALSALDAFGDIETLYLVGDEAQIKGQLSEKGASAAQIGRVEILHTDQVVSMSEPATAALRGKKNSSVTKAVDLVKAGEASAVVSAGHTGAAVAASTVRLRNLPGVERAGIASSLPNDHGPCHLIDAGANPEAKAVHLLQYAIMGTVYCRHVVKKENPVVGLMSVGEEDEKGTDFTKEVFAMLKESGLNFRGNVEGHDLFNTELDVVVCDGFVGNVVLKSCEATAKALLSWIREELTTSGPLVKIGAGLAKPAFRKVKERGSSDTVGGSPLLGVNGTTIIGHGSSSALAIHNAIRVAGEAVRHEVNPHIEEEIARRTPSS